MLQAGRREELFRDALLDEVLAGHVALRNGEKQEKRRGEEKRKHVGSGLNVETWKRKEISTGADKLLRDALLNEVHVALRRSEMEQTQTREVGLRRRRRGENGNE